MTKESESVRERERERKEIKDETHQLKMKNKKNWMG
jgi:hypothetical protein